MFSTQVAVVLVVFASLALADPKGYFAYPQYSYKYGVDDKLTGDHKTASETRDGDVVKGSYSLIQPDGILRTVEYISTPLTGFQAKVINSGPGAVHAVKAAPVAAYAAKPLVGAIGFGGIGGGYGHGLGLGHGAAVVKPAAVAYTQSIGPLAFGGGHGGGFGYGGHGFGGHGAYGGYGGFRGGYGGY